jgi:hypothetical protein
MRSAALLFRADAFFAPIGMRIDGSSGMSMAAEDIISMLSG